LLVVAIPFFFDLTSNTCAPGVGAGYLLGNCTKLPYTSVVNTDRPYLHSITPTVSTTATALYTSVTKTVCREQGATVMNRTGNGSQLVLSASKGTPCPNKINISSWQGRFGNHMHQIVFAVLAAELCSVRSVDLALYRHKFPLDLPRKLWLNETKWQKTDSDYAAPSTMLPCKPKILYRWQKSHLCHNFTVRQYRRVALQYLRPLMKRDVRNCLDNRTWPAGDDEVLTVHLRAGDIVRWNGRSAGQAPCSMYEKILLQGHFAKVHVVFEPVGPCVCCQHIRSCAERLKIGYSQQSTTIHNDFCTLAKARHLVLSFSTFAVSAALISTDVKTLHRRGDSNWGTVQLHSMLPSCSVWPGIMMFEWTVEPQLNKYNWTQADKFLRTFPLERIHGPTVCCPS